MLWGEGGTNVYQEAKALPRTPPPPPPPPPPERRATALKET